MDSIAIYTCIIGAYDSLKQPAVTAEGFDFICFVGQGEQHPDRDGVWEIRELPMTLSDRTLDARYPKMNPHELLPDYECSVWIDGNISINDGTVYKAARIKESAGVKYSGVSHPSRDCTYVEAKKCRDMRYISYFKLAQVWLKLALSGLPLHYGLNEANLMFRRHNDPDIIRFDLMWWDKVLHFCRRDQLSLMLCLKKCGIARDYLLPQGQNTRNHPGFSYLTHDKNGQRH